VRKFLLIIAVIFVFLFVDILIYLLVIFPALVLQSLEQSFPILRPLVGALLIIGLVWLLVVSFQRMMDRAEKLVNESGFRKLFRLLILFRWGNIFLADLIVLTVLVILFLTNYAL